MTSVRVFACVKKTRVNTRSVFTPACLRLRIVMTSVRVYVCVKWRSLVYFVFSRDLHINKNLEACLSQRPHSIDILGHPMSSTLTPYIRLHLIQASNPSLALVFSAIATYCMHMKDLLTKSAVPVLFPAVICALIPFKYLHENELFATTCARCHSVLPACCSESMAAVLIDAGDHLLIGRYSRFPRDNKPSA
ncbi:hypothetical protein XELAEV_18034889mg [Xenopus laevis]|uniref:Uncharacterized protein n=1 Tax=Xenopus laevis TaxID=8355 RepID=A0A974HBI9_XENLA|nr:hypothetical protein XELAEV_18034889mg [Xenopus laevis]